MDFSNCLIDFDSQWLDSGFVSSDLVESVTIMRGVCSRILSEVMDWPLVPLSTDIKAWNSSRCGVHDLTHNLGRQLACMNPAVPYVQNVDPGSYMCLEHRRQSRAVNAAYHDGDFNENLFLRSLASLHFHRKSPGLRLVWWVISALYILSEVCPFI